jgi:acetylornithine deacetylase/succinyl-diaminopimelate desuccinylase-like protein
MGEEVLGPGARHVAAMGALAGSRYLVIGEPTRLDVCIALKGITRWSATAHGIAAHASTPQLGASAVRYAAGAMLALEAWPFPTTPWFERRWTPWRKQVTHRYSRRRSLCALVLGGRLPVAES